MPFTPPASTGGGTPGGDDTEIQYNNSGAFEGDPEFVINKTTKKVTIDNSSDYSETIADVTKTGDGFVTTYSEDDVNDFPNGVNPPWRVVVYAYKDTSHGRVRSANACSIDPYYDGDTSGSGNYYHFSLSWNAVSGADGYCVGILHDGGDEPYVGDYLYRLQAGTSIALVDMNNYQSDFVDDFSTAGTASPLAGTDWFDALDVQGDVNVGNDLMAVNNITATEDIIGKNLFAKGGTANNIVELGGDEVSEYTSGHNRVFGGVISGSPRLGLDSGTQCYQWDVYSGYMRWYYPGNVMLAIGASAKDVKFYGLISQFNNVATMGMGVPYIPYRAVQTGKSAAISATNCTNANAAGEYRISYYIVCTTAKAGDGSIVLNILANDGTAARTIVSASLDLTATNYVEKVDFVHLGSGYVQWSTTLTGSITDARYAVYLTCERLN